MKEITLSKVDVARRQLVTAVQLYFNWGEEVSIHTLAASARNLLCDLCKNCNVNHPLELNKILADSVKPEYHKEVWKKIREPENFFKHADNDPEENLTFNSETTEYILLEAVEAYTALTCDHVPEFNAYYGWYVLHHQNCLTEASDDFLRVLNWSTYAANRRTQYFTEILTAMTQQV